MTLTPKKSQTDEVKRQLPVILSFLDDARRIIEGGKTRRWEVFKWTVALNGLLATASFTQLTPSINPWALPIIAAVVSLMGALLIHHYDGRVTKARERAANLARWLRIHVIDIYAIMGETKLIAPQDKDVDERWFFYVVIFASFIIVLFIAALK